MKKNTQETPSRSAIRRQREKEQRFETILRAAETLFTEKGYHKTAINEIADLAEVSVGTVYFYFNGKEDLLARITEEIGMELRKLVGKKFEAAKSGLTGFKEAGLSFFRDFCLPHPGKVALLFREAVGLSETVETCRKRLFLDLTKDVENALCRIADEEATPFASAMTPEVMAVCIAGIYERVAYHYLLWNDHPENDPPADIMEVGNKAVSFLMGGVTALLASNK